MDARRQAEDRVHSLEAQPTQKLDPKRQYRRQSAAQSPSAKAHSAGLLPKAEEALEQVEE